MLAAFNLSFRLTRASVAEWDESLYALSASEMLQGGEWVATTFEGKLDYYNSKPPLNIWLLALSFKVLGTSLLSLRLVSVVAAWTTVLVLMLWARRVSNAAAAIFAGLVLATTFAFLHVHSGRSGNPDALMTLLMLLIVVVMWASSRRPAVVSWLGPLLAGVFLLKGMAVLMPLAFVGAALLWKLRSTREVPWRPLVIASVLFFVPTLGWAIARFQVDQWQFLRLLVTQDFVAAATTRLDGHRGPLLFYPNVLQRFHYDWLAAGIVATALTWTRVREAASMFLHRVRSGDTEAFSILAWAVLCFAVPTAMQTKLWWYLNPFYPIFALGIGWLLYAGLLLPAQTPQWRRWTVAAVAVLALGVAEGKLLWQPVHKMNLSGSVQELIMLSADEVQGRVVFQHYWSRGERFVLRGMARATTGVAGDVEQFLRSSSKGDLFVADASLFHDELEMVRANGRYAIFRPR